MSLYDDLGVAKDADAAAIKKAHRRKVKKSHPDNTETGDAEEFRRAQHAYLVLSDPDRRKRYDETGADEDTAGRGRSPEEMERDEALQALGAMIVGLLSNSDSALDYTDLQKPLLSQVRAQAQQMGADKAKARGEIKRAEKMAKRWRKKKPDGADLIAAILASHLAGLSQRISQIERAERINEHLRTMIADYEYAFDDPAKNQSSFQNMVEQVAKEELGGFDPFNHPMFNKMNRNR